MKILIIKTSALGDVIQCFPALDYLHRLFPDADIDWVVEKPFAELLKAHPLIHYVHEVETKKWKQTPLQSRSWKEAYEAFKRLREYAYDLAIDFQGNLKSGLLIGSAKSREKVGFSRKTAPEWPNTFFTSKRVDIDLSKPIISQYLALAAASFPDEPIKGSSQVNLKISAEEKEWVKSQLKKGPRMMICVGSNWENKRLSLETWQVFLEKVKEKFSPIFYLVWGSEKEREEVETLKKKFPKVAVTLPWMSLPVWQQMMAQMDVVLSVDSSALHLAATTTTRTYSFFGPSSPEVYKPVGNHHGFFRGSCPYGQSFTKRCTKLRSCESGACLKNALPNALFDHFSHWMVS